MTDLSVVMHCHSTWSYDGSWSLAGIARLFGGLGHHVVMMSEHDTGFDPQSFAAYRAACAAASTGRCTLVPGIEYSSPDNDIHILCWGLDAFLAEHRPVAETLERVAAAGGVAVLAHPVRREAWRAYDDRWTPLLSGVEIWNRKSDGIAPGERAMDLAARTGLPAVAGMDFHRARQIWSLSNRVAAGGARPPEAAVVSAIGAGALCPRSFGRPLLGADGAVSEAALARARRHERLRRRVLALARRHRR